MRSRVKIIHIVNDSERREESQNVFDAHVEHTTYDELRSSLQMMRPHASIISIICDCVSMPIVDDARVQTITHHSYNIIQPNDILFVFYDQKQHLESELKILESFHRRILCLENRNIV